MSPKKWVEVWSTMEIPRIARSWCFSPSSVSSSSSREHGFFGKALASLVKSGRVEALAVQVAVRR
eukprot:4474587-Heterocapsa_arctica.AAC.1